MPDDTFERLSSSLSDRYRIEKRIGQGGMATVFLAEDLKHGRRVAIKVLRPELSAALGAERFLREIEVAARLQHPHIIPLYDSGNAGGVLYYVMPFIEGESLRDLLRREGRLPLARAAEIIREAASGLAFAHGRGIVHRDIKPENIMLSDGHAVIADFGIARAVDASRSTDANLTGAGMALGTPAYMSPEQATADAVDARSDQYALACVFYEMVSGRQAFSGSSMQAMLTSILTGPRPKLAAADIGPIPPEVDAATQRALSVDPEKRFPDITAFSRAVTRESSGAAAATRETRRWRRLAIVMPLLVAAAAVAWVVTSGRTQRMVVSGAETIAVVPFTVNGGGLEGIGEGMVDLLSSSLDGVGGIRTIEARTVVRDWRRRVGAGGAGDLEDAIAVARAARAASVLTGNVVASGGNARLTAELYDLNGSVLAQAQVSGATDSVLALADGLALGLLREIWRSREPLPSARTTAISSASIPAIRAYLVGERYHRRGEWDSAQIAFETAVDADSTFALAWYRLASTLGWKGQYQHIGAVTAAANAERYSTNLPQRLRSLFAAYNLFSKGDVAAIDSAMAYTVSYPDDADGWFLLAEAQYHTRASRPMSPARLRAPFDRVLELDSSLSPAAIHPLELSLAERDTALITRYAAVFRRAGAENETQRLDRARRALEGDGTGLAEVFGAGTGVGITMATLEGLIRAPGVTGGDVDRIMETVESSASGSTAALQQQFQMLRALTIQGIGRRKAALEHVNRLETLRNSDGGLVVMLGPVLGGYADSTMLIEADRRLEQFPQSMYITTWRGLIALDRGNPDRAVSLVRATAVSDSAPRWLRGAATMVAALATIAKGDTTGGMIQADSAIRLIGGAVATAFTTPALVRYAEFEVSRPATRQRGIERLKYGFPSTPDLVPLNTLRLARAYEAAGLRDSAHVRYAAFLGYWDQADAEFAGIVEEARAGLARTAPDAAPGSRGIDDE